MLRRGRSLPCKTYTETGVANTRPWICMKYKLWNSYIARGSIVGDFSKRSGRQEPTLQDHVTASYHAMSSSKGQIFS